MTTDEVLRANARFYQAFARGDARAMDELWARDAPVACVHPGWRIIDERAIIINSWRMILGEGPTPISCERPRVLCLDDSSAVVTCVEQLGDSELTATNVFTREAGEWRLVHHHAGPIVARPSAPRVLN